MTGNIYTADWFRRTKEECDAAGTPYPWARPFKAVIMGDCLVDGLSVHPMTRGKCPKCGYTLATNTAPQGAKCPIDGETLGLVPYP